MFRITSLLLILIFNLLINFQANMSLAEEVDKENIDSVEDSIQNYELIAIYLVGNEPRALIKNLEIPEEGVIEYKVGDFLSSKQIFSISKILFNPTARVEFIDKKGLSYLVKPRNIDFENLSGVPKGNFSTKPLPTYFSTKDSQNKSKKNIIKKKIDKEPSDTTTTSTSPVSSTDTSQGISPTTGSEKVTSPGALQPAQTPTSDSTQNVSMTSIQSGTSASTQTTSTAPAKVTPTNAPDSLDVSRPANPFE